MGDLLIGLLVIGLIASIVLIVTLRASRFLPARASNLLAILTVAMMIGFAVFLQDSVAMTHWLPLANVVVLGNWQPVFVAALAGLIWNRIPRPTWRRALVVGPLIIVCLLVIYRPITVSPPAMKDRWDFGVCLQTSQASCSPAAAATFLLGRGIRTTEQEMALLCLTSDEGTSMHGLYRGLRLKTAGSGLDVYMFSNGKIDDLRGMGPVLLSVELRPGPGIDPRYLRSWGWLPGVPHTVVLLRFIGRDTVLVADPATGRELWNVRDLRMLWHGVGVRLIPAKR